jgi:hypothetical protein
MELTNDQWNFIEPLLPRPKIRKDGRVVLVVEKSPTSVAQKSSTYWLIKTIQTDQIA